MAFCRFVNAEPTQLDRRVAFQSFFVREALLFTETVEFGLVLEIIQSNFVIGKTAISINLTCIVNVNTSVTNRQQMFLKFRSSPENEIV